MCQSDILVDRIVFNTKIIRIAESKHRAETQRRWRMSLHEGIFYEYAVLMRDKHFLFCQHNTSHAECHYRDILAIELADVFVTVGTENIVTILM